jgi:Ca2+-binding EF-hand superfamily protein
MLTSDDILSEDKFVEFVKSFGIELSDARIGQFLRIFDYHHECEVDMKELGAAYSAYFKYEG